MTAQTVNYTPEQVTQLVAGYQAGETVEALAAAVGKSVKSVVAKLAREGVYQPKAKAKAGAGRVTKANMTELVEDLLMLERGALESLQKGSHEALEALAAALTNRVN
jgi:hypothetical protein